MKTNYETVRELAKSFLDIADELNEAVNRFFDCSDDPEDVAAFERVKEADKKFVDAVNNYFGKKDYNYGLNYELAEYFI